ncbi:hybrid sensor histidine kinase/response regulator [Thauera butanivorans]|uniref:hybrid sensor histidine kinase/response regulator n=1 Tax=Thauera butanivorans TaxID=86174 RepID=UPI0008388135|nr:PAS domain S-box protein [Thauera butanivorans]
MDLEFFTFRVHEEDEKMPKLAGLDITPFMQAQAVLRESEAHFRSIADTAPAILWETGPDGAGTFVSRGWYEYTGQTEAAALGHGWLDVLHPEDRDEVTASFGAAIDQQSPFAREYRLRRADGVYRWVLDQGRPPPFSPSGSFLGYVGSVVDITEHRQAEDALQAAKAEAERANEAKSRFLPAASHDLRQPLSALSVYAKVLEGHVDSAGAPFLAKLKACLGCLGALLSELLDLSKLQAGAIKPNCGNFPVADVLARLLSVHEPETGLKSLRLHCWPSTLWGRTDAVLFECIVGNVIENAVRYTDDGGVLVGCRRRGGKAWVEVWDTGICIPPDKTAEIFEEFRQLDGARTCGSGLGLAPVAKTAELLGLEVRVRSRPGRGSAFAIELPLGCSSPGILPEFDIVPGRALRIALAEDNASVREALTEALQSIGRRVWAADSGPALCAVLGEAAPDIVISDYRLAHGETGVDVIRATRDAVGRDVPAILMTGDTDPDLPSNIALHRAVVLHKPLDLETLHAYIEDLSNSDDNPA